MLWVQVKKAIQAKADQMIRDITNKHELHAQRRHDQLIALIDEVTFRSNIWYYFKKRCEILGKRNSNMNPRPSAQIPEENHH